MQPKASLRFYNGPQTVACFDIDHLEADVSSATLRADGSDEVDVTVKGRTSVKLLPFLLSLDGRAYQKWCALPYAEPRTILPKISRVIFNYPATVVFWDDGTKTVVKCQLGDVYDKEKGIMACMLKRFMGNDNTFNKVLNRWVKEDV